MANYQQIKEVIDAYIKRNGRRLITGDLLNTVLNLIVGTLGKGVSKDSTEGECPSGKAVYDFVLPEVQTEIPAEGLTEFLIYRVGVIGEDVEVSLRTPADPDVENIYTLIFETGETVPVITWDEAITKWAGNCLSIQGRPELKVNKHYEVSIADGIGFILEV